MKILIKNKTELQKAGRWDIDFHLPAEGIKIFPTSLLKRLDEVAVIAKDKRDPTKNAEKVFYYVDISSVDVSVGAVVSHQELEGADAPSRARKVVRAFDLIISTCRPTRGAVAVVPVELHNQIASTGFSVVRPKESINPFYLQYALRLPSTLEQFRKWSTGSSYPAILDEDVAKTLIPVPSPDEQDRIAGLVVAALKSREIDINKANMAWNNTLAEITNGLSGKEQVVSTTEVTNEKEEQDTEVEKKQPYTINDIEHILSGLPPLNTDKNSLEELTADDI